MLNRLPALFLAALVLNVLSGCTPEAPKPPAGEVAPKPIKPRAHLSGDAGGHYQAKKLTGDFRGYPQAEAFVARMVETQGFTREYLYGVLSQAKRKT